METETLGKQVNVEGWALFDTLVDRQVKVEVWLLGNTLGHRMQTRSTK